MSGCRMDTLITNATISTGGCYTFGGWGTVLGRAPVQQKEIYVAEERRSRAVPAEARRTAKLINQPVRAA